MEPQIQSPATLDEITIVVQYVSAILEVLGIGLAFIELKFPKLADKLEGKINLMDEKARDTAYKLLEHKGFATLVTLFIFVIFFFEIPYLFNFFKALPPPWNTIQEIFFWVSLPVVIMFVLGISVILLSSWVTSLNNFSKGRAIGALGIFVASMGLMGEAFQIWVIIFY